LFTFVSLLIDNPLTSAMMTMILIPTNYTVLYIVQNWQSQNTFPSSPNILILCLDLSWSQLLSYYFQLCDCNKHSTNHPFATKSSLYYLEKHFILSKTYITTKSSLYVLSRKAVIITKSRLYYDERQFMLPRKAVFISRKAVYISRKAVYIITKAAYNNMKTKYWEHIVPLFKTLKFFLYQQLLSYPNSTSCTVTGVLSLFRTPRDTTISSWIFRTLLTLIYYLFLTTH
jgi:hypothetical protein